MATKIIFMKKQIFLYFIFLLSISILSSCEEEFIPETINAEQQYIVEGYVSSSTGRVTPPYVILTKSIPFFSEINQEKLNDIFVKNATVSINDGEKSVPLTLFCLEDLTPEQKKMFTSGLGLDSINKDFNFCIYIDILNQINVHENGKYDLDIQVDDHHITASTTIPKYIGLDSLWMQELPTPVDTLKQLYCRIADPADESNYYQFKNGYVGKPLVTPIVSSLADFLFDGKDFKFPMDRAVKNIGKADRQTFRYFRTGDSIQVEWICIDQEQYEFWNTLELDRIQQGPFSTYVKAKSNINGGLGVFTGKSSKIYKLSNE